MRCVAVTQAVTQGSSYFHWVVLPPQSPLFLASWVKERDGGGRGSFIGLEVRCVQLAHISLLRKPITYSQFTLEQKCEIQPSSPRKRTQAWWTSGQSLPVYSGLSTFPAPWTKVYLFLEPFLVTERVENFFGRNLVFRSLNFLQNLFACPVYSLFVSARSLFAFFSPLWVSLLCFPFNLLIFFLARTKLLCCCSFVLFCSMKKTAMSSCSACFWQTPHSLPHSIVSSYLWLASAPELLCFSPFQVWRAQTSMIKT